MIIADRRAEVEDRAVPGHWDGDLSLSAHHGSAIGALSNGPHSMLLHPPADHGATVVRNAITSTIASLPAELRRSLTWDQGIELIGILSWPSVLLGSGGPVGTLGVWVVSRA